MITPELINDWFWQIVFRGMPLWALFTICLVFLIITTMIIITTIMWRKRINNNDTEFRALVKEVIFEEEQENENLKTETILEDDKKDRLE